MNQMSGKGGGVQPPAAEEKSGGMAAWEKYEEQERLQRGYSESYFSAMKRRLNLQRISAYIRLGGDQAVVSHDSFHQRERDAFEKLEKRVAGTCGEGAGQMMDQILAYASVIEEIYFNLGMKAGVILHGKLTGNFETDI